MNRVFDAYAEYYDLLYRDKDYVAEANYVASAISKRNPDAKRILELGCGTGGHAVLLASMGFSVLGIDVSPQMIARAEARKKNLPSEAASRVSFQVGDVRDFRNGTIFDAVVLLFHVMSYQTTNRDLKDTLATAHEHLTPGGTLLFDFWHGPAVLHQKPEIRVKRLADDRIEVTRIAEPTLDVGASTVEVSYSLFVTEKASGHIGKVSETHKLRYLFLTELEELLAGRFASVAASEWMTGNTLTTETWNAVVCAART